MRKLFLFFLITGLLGAAYFFFSPKEDSFLLGGIQVNEPDQKEWMSTLKDVGMNTVSITVYSRQGIWNSDNIWWDKEEDGVMAEIKAAKQAGLKVVLIPRTLLDHWFPENQFLWHGMTMPANDSLLNNWFDSYGLFLERWAKVCEEYDVEVMAIGSELRALSATRPVKALPVLEEYYLNPDKQQAYLDQYLRFEKEIEIKNLWVRGADNFETLESYKRAEIAANRAWAKQLAFDGEEQVIDLINQRRQLLDQLWRKLIGRVRQHYSGKLTYAANFDNYHNVNFWDQLDFIGINAYFKLRNWKSDSTASPIYPELLSSWQSIFKDIEIFQDTLKINKPVLFTELGYIYRKNCTLMPWEGHGFSILEDDNQQQVIIWPEQPENQEERTLAIQALLEVHRSYEAPLLQGILYWKLTTKDYHMPYEPFALHIGPGQPDPMLEELQQFRFSFPIESYNLTSLEAH